VVLESGRDGEWLRDSIGTFFFLNFVIKSHVENLSNG
jgi:hypothetical protein